MKRRWIYIVGFLVLATGGIVYYEHRKAASEEAAPENGIEGVEADEAAAAPSEEPSLVEDYGEPTEPETQAEPNNFGPSPSGGGGGYIYEPGPAAPAPTLTATPPAAAVAPAPSEPAEPAGTGTGNGPKSQPAQPAYTYTAPSQASSPTGPIKIGQHTALTGPGAKHHHHKK